MDPRGIVQERRKQPGNAAGADNHHRRARDAADGEQFVQAIEDSCMAIVPGCRSDGVECHCHGTIWNVATPLLILPASTSSTSAFRR
ncbi:MAG: hypothetical protein IPK83_06160 [Planctomycetes bacterium]|nr:hypothetical protein [Planctomycetota bacterium]